MFDIYLTGEVVPESDDHAVYGRIQIEDHTEMFVASLVCWRPAQYERHWQEACHRIIAGRQQSALISSYAESSMSEFLMWWPLYRDGQIVHVRNELVFYSQLSWPFSVEDPWSSIRDRRIVTEQGLEISEWDMRIQSVEEFLERKQGADWEVRDGV
jgi:hypothetical protein